MSDARVITIRIDNNHGRPLYMIGPDGRREIPPFTWIDSDGNSGRTVIKGGSDPTEG